MSDVFIVSCIVDGRKYEETPAGGGFFTPKLIG